jgi:hypothetical protein
MAKAQESDHDKSGLLTRVHVNVDLSLAIERFSVFRFEATTAFLNFITGSRHVV